MKKINVFRIILYFKRQKHHIVDYCMCSDLKFDFVSIVFPSSAVELHPGMGLYIVEQVKQLLQILFEYSPLAKVQGPLQIPTKQL